MAIFHQYRKNPLIHENEVSWIYSGKKQPGLVGDFNFWNREEPLSFERNKNGLWEAHLVFPNDAYIEYAFCVDKKRKLDPLNVDKVQNGLGEWNNYFSMPAFEKSPFLIENTGNPFFKVRSQTLHDSLRLANGKRRVNFFIPPGEGPFPLLIIFDGQEFLQKGKIIQIIENLIKLDKLQSIAVALVENVYQNRFVEYACNDGTVSFITRNVIPAANALMPLIKTEEENGAFGIMGASMGGLMALYTALRMPSIFRKVLCQAGAFKMLGDDFSIYEFIDGAVRKPVEIWMNVGHFDFLYAENLRMKELLSKKGYPVELIVNNGGHNYTTWRNSIHLGLMRLFPPQNKVKKRKE